MYSSVLYDLELSLAINISLICCIHFLPKKWPVEVAVNKKKANSYKLYNPESFHIMHNYKSDKPVGVKMTREYYI